MKTERGIHWQLFWFSAIALAHGAYFTAAIFSRVRLSAGVGAIPDLFYLVLSIAWAAAGIFGILCALVTRVGHGVARWGIGTMAGFWAGAYVYGWIWGGASSGWLLAIVYGCLGLAVVTPPVWTVTIKSSQAGD